MFFTEPLHWSPLYPEPQRVPFPPSKHDIVTACPAHGTSVFRPSIRKPLSLPPSCTQWWLSFKYPLLFLPAPGNRERYLYTSWCQFPQQGGEAGFWCMPFQPAVPQSFCTCWHDISLQPIESWKVLFLSHVNKKEVFDVQHPSLLIKL